MNVKRICLLQIFKFTIFCLHYLSEVRQSVIKIELNYQIIHCKNQYFILTTIQLLYDWHSFSKRNMCVVVWLFYGWNMNVTIIDILTSNSVHLDLILSSILFNSTQKSLIHISLKNRLINSTYIWLYRLQL